jgi:hypothetical protein
MYIRSLTHATHPHSLEGMSTQVVLQRPTGTSKKIDLNPFLLHSYVVIQKGKGLMGVQNRMIVIGYVTGPSLVY